MILLGHEKNRFRVSENLQPFSNLKVIRLSQSGSAESVLVANALSA